MNWQPDSRRKVVRLWQSAQRLLILVAVFSPFLMLDVIIRANERGSSVPFALIIAGPLVLIGMMAFMGEMVRRIFNFTVGARVCKWWWQS